MKAGSEATVSKLFSLVLTREVPFQYRGRNPMILEKLSTTDPGVPLQVWSVDAWQMPTPALV